MNFISEGERQRKEESERQERNCQEEEGKARGKGGESVGKKE